jgi:hypothetical protein
MNNEMKLQEGKSCSLCYAFSWCERLFGCKPDAVECDYFPVRFKERISEIMESQ